VFLLKKKFWLFPLLAGVLTLVAALFLAQNAASAANRSSLSPEQILAESYHSVQAASPEAASQGVMDTAPAGSQLNQGQSTPADNSACLSCHAQPGMQTKLPNGEILYLTVDQKTFDGSVHGQQGLNCTQCHTSITGYPHDPLPGGIVSRRDFTIWTYQTCTQCHAAEKDVMTNDAHQKVLQQGNQNAAVCTDCHGAHDVQVPNEPRSRIPQTCQKCHSQIYDLYKGSVHGAALIFGEGQDSGGFEAGQFPAESAQVVGAALRFGLAGYFVHG
jgi:predicted CXXCH cytochrome family protein